MLKKYVVYVAIFVVGIGVGEYAGFQGPVHQIKQTITRVTSNQFVVPTYGPQMSHQGFTIQQLLPDGEHTQCDLKSDDVIKAVGWVNDKLMIKVVKLRPEYEEYESVCTVGAHFTLNSQKWSDLQKRAARALKYKAQADAFNSLAGFD